MIVEEYFDLQDIWKIASKGDEMTLLEQDTMNRLIDMLPESKCTKHIMSELQDQFIRKVLPDLFRKTSSIIPELTQAVGLNMSTSFKYTSPHPWD